LPTSPANLSQGSFGEGSAEPAVRGQDRSGPNGYGPNGPGSRQSGGNMLLNHLLMDAYQLGMRANQRSAGGSGNSGLDLSSLFQMGSQISSDLGQGKSGVLGTALGVLLKLNQLSRSGFNLPLNSAAGRFQFSYKDQLGTGGNALGGGIGSGSAQASFTSRSLKNEMFHFSAAAMLGGVGGGSGFGGGGQSSFMGSGSESGGSGMSFGSISGSNGIGAGIGSSSGGFMRGASATGGGGMMGGGGGMMGGGPGPGAGGQGHPGGGGDPKHSGSGSGPSLSLKLTF